MNGKLLFVGGDLSGIQKFIYNISSKKAMVSLKGRSAYLKEFTDSVCNRILDIPEISGSHSVKDDMKIYCSGGKFYLQIPDTDEIRKAIDKIKLDIEKELWEEHFGQLAINIGYVPFRYSNELVTVGNQTGNIGLLWQRITEKFAALKNQKFKNLLINGYKQFYLPQPTGGDVKVCAITGIESPDCVKLDRNEGDGDEIWVLPSVKEHIKRGQELRNSQNFKTLEEYAKDSYLGVLRMDVDGLGKKFIQSSFKSISEYKKFSKRLDDFFGDELQKIQNDNGFREFLNIVYAGGDDIFVVGKWNKVIDFAEVVSTKFKSYINDGALSISGGVAIVGPKFPIAKAAELAGDAEDIAKKYNNGQKNAFCLFNTAISWNKDFEYVKRFKILLYDHCKNGMPHSILHKLMLFADMKKRGELKYIWHTAYFMKRFKDGKSEEVRSFCETIEKELYNNPKGYELLAVSARWAELELREV